MKPFLVKLRHLAGADVLGITIPRQIVRELELEKCSHMSITFDKKKRTLTVTPKADI